MSSSEKVIKTGIRREDGWLYFVDRKGNVSRSKMIRGIGSTSKGTAEILATTQVRREPGWLYFVDKDGDVARVKMLLNTANVEEEGTSPSKSSQKKKTAPKVKKKLSTRRDLQLASRLKRKVSSRKNPNSKSKPGSRRK